MKRALNSPLILGALLLFLVIPGQMIAQERNTAQIDLSIQDDVVAFGQRIPSQSLPLTDRDLLATLLSSQRYIVTPGDRYSLVVSIDDTMKYELTIQNDGTLEIPFLGTLDATGKEYSSLRNSILTSFRNRIPADYVEFELTAPARFEVFVGGAVRSPGTMIVHAMHRAHDVVRLADGADKHGSIRRIELVRTDGSAHQLDLARFFETGEDQFNPLLRPGDRLYVPTAEITVSISGSVRYPGSYELLPSEQLPELVAWAGGFQPDADADHIEISGYSSHGVFGRQTVKFEFTGYVTLKDQDSVNVPSTDRHAEPITISGAFYGQPYDGRSPITIPTKPIQQTIPYSTGLSLRQAMAVLGGPTPHAATETSFVIRSDTKRISFDAAAVWDGSNPDIPLRANDSIVVPIDRVTVSITGAVELPGEYELLRGATVADLVNQAGGLSPYANRRRIMFRQPDASGQYVSTPVTLSESERVGLRDNAVVRVLSNYGSGSAIVIEGAVFGTPIGNAEPIALPGSTTTQSQNGITAPVSVRLVLPYFPGMTAYDALHAVGGPTPYSLAENSYVLRSDERIELDVNALWASDGLSGDLTLQPRDQVVIPSDDVFVTVIGEVNRPGVIPFQFGLTVSDYLLRAGGATREADLGLVHFVDRTGKRLATAKLDAAVKTGDILIVERQRILGLLEIVGRIAPVVSLFNNVASSVNTINAWISP